MASSVLRASRLALRQGTRAFCGGPPPSRLKDPLPFQPYESPRTLPGYLHQTPGTKVTQLDNGLKVATEEGHGETATVGVWIDAGSSYETEKNNGVAHFLEHMAFKGTNKRSREQIELEVENMGASLNAYTSREQTVYFARSFKKDVGASVDILADILQNSKLETDAIESERSTIIREMEEIERNVEEVVYDQLHAVAYQNDPLGFTILGPRANVRSLKRDDLVNYINTHYSPDRMVLAGAGAVSHDALVDYAKRSFGGMAKKPFPKPAKPEFVGSMVTIHDHDMPVVHAAIAAESVGWSHPEYFTFQVIQAIIGSWDRESGAGKNISSRLGEHLAMEGTAHSMTAFHTCYHNTGLFGIYSTFTSENSWDAICDVVTEWVRISHQVSETEVERAKNKVKAAALMQLNSSSAVAEDVGRQILTLGRRMTPAEIFSRIDAITTDHVKAVATEYLTDVDVAVCAIGPFTEMPDYNHIRGFTYWNRL